MYIIFRTEDIGRSAAKGTSSSCELRSRQKCFWAPICIAEGIPHISKMYFQIALTSEHVAGFGWVPFSELRE